MIELKQVNIELPDFRVRDISLSIRNGEFFMLLGPTGAGKTVILEAIAGLVELDRGSIYIKQRDISELPPEKRGIGIVYQDYALFPHLSVWKNIIYGLRYHHKTEEESADWLQWLINELDIQSILHRTPTNLSGGEKQRVALARALAVHPSVLLLDEPLSALDPNFREGIRELLKKLHQELQMTFLMVTHDFAEALFLGDRMAILHDGRIEQVGAVSDVFYQPATPFVAEFVGMKNVFPATFQGETASIHSLQLQLARPPQSSSRYIGIRSEDILLSAERPVTNGENILVGKVVQINHLGFYHEVSVSAGDTLFRTIIPGSALFTRQLTYMTPVHISIRPSAIHTF